MSQSFQYPPQLPPETYNYLIQALLSLHPAPPIPPPAVTLPQSTASAALPTVADDALSVSEDKRRRNTTASARFRVKKKLKALSLERTVADLTGRTDELEREAAELRRENAWLKEILILKSRGLVGLHALAPGNRVDEPGSEQSAAKGKDKES